MNFYIMTLFPDMVLGGLGTSITGRAMEKGAISVEALNIRDYAINRHGQVDDAPYGGGAGQVMQPAPICDCYEALCSRLGKRPRVLYMTPQGRVFNQTIAMELAREEELVFLCGHYEGVDERALELLQTEDLSIGDYVLTGGELPAMVMIDCISRLVPGVLHNDASAEIESFHDNLLEYPQYTRPEDYRGLKVPEVLLTGHHQKIENWRRLTSVKRTFERRPELLEQGNLSKKEREYLSELKIEALNRPQKEAAYAALVKQIQEYVIGQNGGKEPFEGYAQCDAADPWAYWQGRSVTADGAAFHHLDAKILLVGPGWGSPSRRAAAAASIRDINSGRSRRYIRDGVYDGEHGRMRDETDEQVRRLFLGGLGYDLLRSGTENPRNQQLFFTNFWPSPKTGAAAGGQTAAAGEFFRELERIIGPQVILCLGCDVYRGVCRALGADVAERDIRPYSRFVEKDKGLEILREDGRQTKVFALAHPGRQGALHRADGGDAKDGMKRMEDDWKKIAGYLKKRLHFQ